MNVLIVTHQLMSEEKLLVAPFGLGELTIQLEGTDQLFFTAKLFRSIKCVNFIKFGIGWNRLELFNVNHRILSWEISWEQSVNIGVRFES